MGRLPDRPFLYPLTDRRSSGVPAGEAAARLFAAGARVVQIRDKDLDDRELLQQVDIAVAAAQPFGAMVIVNDRADLALATGAAGVHLGDRDLPAHVVRGLLGPRFVIGASTHAVEEALMAADTPIDYVAFGPVFASTTKPGRPALGLAALARVCRESPLPVVAIGGIGPTELASVVAAGAAGAAMVAGAVGGGHIEAHFAALLEVLGRQP